MLPIPEEYEKKMKEREAIAKSEAKDPLASGTDDASYAHGVSTKAFFDTSKIQPTPPPLDLDVLDTAAGRDFIFRTKAKPSWERTKVGMNKTAEGLEEQAAEQRSGGEEQAADDKHSGKTEEHSAKTKEESTEKQGDDRK